MSSHCFSPSAPVNQSRTRFLDQFQRSLFDLTEPAKSEAKNKPATAEGAFDGFAHGSLRPLDPARWAGVCRCLGNLTPNQFKNAEKRLFPNPDSIKSRFKRLFCFEQAECDHLPLVCLGKLDTDG